MSGCEISRRGVTPPLVYHHARLAGARSVRGGSDAAANRSPSCGDHGTSLDRRCRDIVDNGFVSVMTGHDTAATDSYLQTIEQENHRLHAQVVQLAEAEAALRRQTDELERSNEQLERYALVASHDLREPLHVVAGLLELLSDDLRSSDAAQLLDRARAGIAELSALVDELLTLARASTGELLLEHIALDDLVDDAIAAAVAHAPDTAVTPTHDPLPTIVGDRWHLARVFTHLLDNALEFRRHDEVTPVVHVSLSRSDDKWVISVRDNGIGIRPEAMSELFTLFSPPRRGGDITGRGAGLAICRRVVERHGGTITADSIPGRGTTISFTLPVARDAA
jgi:signal transduction histidine kinase